MSEDEFILYRTDDGRDEIQLRADGETVWLTQAEMADLFQTSPQAITQLIGAIYREEELMEPATCKKLLQVRSEGQRRVRRKLRAYNLDMILAIGYRVRSSRGVQFRRWATTTLSEYLIKGFVINDERLKDPAGFDYFDELLERIRDIRASEKRFYQKVRDLFAKTSSDYDGKSETSRLFFKTIQNKMIYAVTEKTAAELIVARADPDKTNMALTSWSGNRVRKKDVSVSKNYLTGDEVQELNRLVTMFLDFAEDRAARRTTISMDDWKGQADRFLSFNERSVLSNAGAVSHNRMGKIVSDRFDAFDDNRRKAEMEAAEEEHLHELEEIEAQVKRLPKSRDS